MKIGIITFHQALNYGALLQAYALQRILNSMGAYAEIIDYHCRIIEDAYVFPSLKRCRTLKDVMKYFLQGKIEIEKRKRFDVFRQQKLNLSDKCYAIDSIKDAELQYDRLVAGSDQVWNCNAHNFDKNYFLQFVKDPKKKFSYAASIGLSKIPEQFKKEYYALLKDFSGCSVREKRGLKALTEIGIQDVRVDIDPTLLLSKEEWMFDFSLHTGEGHYIFAYYFELTSSLKVFIEKLSQETGCYVKFLGKPIRAPFSCKCKAVQTADPVDFLDAIANADYVVTNSFHGTVFSIIFNKPFFTELLIKSAEVNSRLIDILEVTGLESRQIQNFSSISDALKMKINWTIVSKKLEIMKKNSLEYIRSIIV